MLHRLHQEDFDTIYRILCDSFPPDERRDYAPQLALFDREIFTTYGLREESSAQVMALITVYDLGECAYVEHFAVSESYRNRGLGSVILSELIAACDKPLILEVELPETEMARRRIGFYERNGFFLNDYPYIQPPYGPDKQPVPLRIMSTDHPLTAEEFQAVKTALYREVYGQ